MAGLGDIEANFRNLVIKWKQGYDKIVLRGDLSLYKGSASWKTMIKALQDDGLGFYVEYYRITKEGEESLTIPLAAVENILEAYQDVFKEPKGLPPKREQNHAITMKEGVKFLM